MRKVLTCILVLVALSGSLQLQLEREKVVVVSNSIDYSSGLIRYLQKSFEVTSITAQEFPWYQSQYAYKYFVILGGPDAPQGIGEIVRTLLSPQEREDLRTRGVYDLFIKLKNGKTYFILAGSDREYTSLASAHLKHEIPLRIPKNPMKWLETMDIAEVIDVVITDLDFDLKDDYVFACRRVVSDPWNRGAIYVFEESTLKWYYHVETTVEALQVYDLDSDRIPEIIVACDVRVDKGGDLYVFDTNGLMKWRKWIPGKPKSMYCYQNNVAVNLYGQEERVMIFDFKGREIKDLPVDGDISKFEIKDVNNDGEYELITAGIVNTKWEHFLVVYDMDEPDYTKRVLWNYETWEHINDFQFYDIDDDGTLETLIGAYNTLYVTRGGDLLGKVELPPSITHVEIIEDKILIVNKNTINTMLLIDFSSVLILNGDTVPVTNFFQIVHSALPVSADPEFLFLRDVDADHADEIVVGNGQVLEVHELSEFGPPEAWVTELAVIAELAPAVEPVITFSTYENIEYGIRIDYPSGWAEEESDIEDVVIVFLSPFESAFDVFRENVYITVKDFSAQPITLDEYTEESIDELRQLISNFTLEESTTATLAGNPAHRLVYTGKIEQYDLKWMQVHTIKDDIAYTITYTAEEDFYSAYVDIVQEMVDSFEIPGEIYLVSVCYVQFDAPGEDNENLNGEWVTLCNDGDTDIDMSGWALLNDLGIYYEFPVGFILRAGSSVTVYTGSGEDTETELYWGSSVEVWNNAGDTATLLDSEGNTVVEYVWIPE